MPDPVEASRSQMPTRPLMLVFASAFGFSTAFYLPLSVVPFYATYTPPRMQYGAARSKTGGSPIDPSLTLTQMQCPAIVSDTRNIKPVVHPGFASLCKAKQPRTAHS
jgi:hypothetical protein